MSWQDHNLKLETYQIVQFLFGLGDAVKLY